MKLAFDTIKGKDMDASLEFYRDMSTSPQIRFALVRDPDGVILQLSEHLEA